MGSFRSPDIAEYAVGMRARTRRPMGTKWLGQVRVDPLEVETPEDMAWWGPLDAAVEARDTGAGAVLDDGDAVDAEERVLEVVPVLAENGAVPAQAAIEQLRLPADLVVLQEIGAVGRDTGRGGAVHTARSEALGVSRVDHRVRHELVGEVDAWHGAVISDALRQVGAGCELDRGRNEVACGISEAVRHARPAGVAVRISKEAIQGVVVLVSANSPGQRELTGHIPSGLRECRLVPIDTGLVGEPDGLEQGRYRIRVRQAGGILR